jgi:hypothetical protein
MEECYAVPRCTWSHVVEPNLAGWHPKPIWVRCEETVSECPRESPLSTPLPVEKEAPFQNTQMSWIEKYGNGSRRDSKQKIAVLARPNR